MMVSDFLGTSIVKKSAYRFSSMKVHWFIVDVKGLIEKLGNAYNPLDERLFIDSSKASSKPVLLHKGNLFASIPLAHSTQIKETYKNIEIMLTKLKYKEHRSKVCVDIKVLKMLQSQQSGYTKLPCFLCKWDSRDKANHWIKRGWPVRILRTSEHKNISKRALVDPSKVMLPTLHIKLVLMKQYVKALDK